MPQGSEPARLAAVFRGISGRKAPGDSWELGRVSPRGRRKDPRGPRTGGGAGQHGHGGCRRPSVRGLSRTGPIDPDHPLLSARSGTAKRDVVVVSSVRQPIAMKGPGTWAILAERTVRLRGSEPMQFRHAHSPWFRFIHFAAAWVVLAAAPLQTVDASAAPAPVAPDGQASNPVDQSLFAALQWRGIGPYRGGRALAVTGVPGDPGHLLLRRRRRRGLEDHRRGATWKPLFTRRSPRSAPSPSRPPTITSSMSAPAKGAPRRHHLWRRRLQVDRRRQDLDRDRPEGHPPDRRPHRRPDQSRHRARRGHRPRLRPQYRARRLPHHRRRQDLDQGALQGRATPARSTSPSIRTIPRSSTPPCGRRAASPGTSPAAVRAAASIARPTAA